MKKIYALMLVILAMLCMVGCKKEKEITISSKVNDDKPFVKAHLETILDSMEAANGLAFLEASYPDEVIESMIKGTEYNKESYAEFMSKHFGSRRIYGYKDAKIDSLEVMEASARVSLEHNYGITVDRFYKGKVSYKAKLTKDSDYEVVAKNIYAYISNGRWYVELLDIE